MNLIERLVYFFYIFPTRRMKRKKNQTTKHRKRTFSNIKQTLWGISGRFFRRAGELFSFGNLLLFYFHSQAKDKVTYYINRSRHIREYHCTIYVYATNTRYFAIYRVRQNVYRMRTLICAKFINIYKLMIYAVLKCRTYKLRKHDFAREINL